MEYTKNHKLFHACIEGNIEKAKELLGLNEKTSSRIINKFSKNNELADIDFKDNNGRTPLHAAVTEDNIDIIKLLLSAGANPNSIDKEGKSVIFKAQSEQAVFELIKKGADPKSGIGIHTAIPPALMIHARLTMQKIEHGGNLNEIDDAIRELAMAGADVSFMNKLDNTQHNLALKELNKENSETVTYIFNVEKEEV